MTISYEDYVVTDRNGIVENRHEIHAAVIDKSGKLLYAVGNPSRLTLARSAAKPSQALAILETGCFDKFGFENADLALMCASHSSEDRHITRTRTILARIQAEETDLRCGGHSALSEEVNRAWIKKDYLPTGVCNNCSGKHAGMLAGAKAIGADITDYHLPDHPMQLRVKRVFEELCGADAHGVKWGTDGCNLPAPALPLKVMGQVYADLAEAADSVEKGAYTLRQSQQSQIFHAMSQHPEQVGGEGRFCTMLMTAFQGLLVGKIGADGCYGIGIRANDQTKRLGADGAVGIAVKVEDGNIPILYAVVAELLERLQIGTPEMRRQLESFHQLKVMNTMNIVTGHATFAFNVRAVQ
jgi:L-asparaginase II